MQQLVESVHARRLDDIVRTVLRETGPTENLTDLLLTSDHYDFVFISQNERESQQSLRKQLRKRRLANPSKSFIIRGSHIVRLNTSNDLNFISPVSTSNIQLHGPS
ncbi:hypothetical protein GJ496_009273 [Pomphorhynchus laevis]|nr:hypothetical protein GJ496_009273 [Pomphorhynchus laevis]